uniref:ANK_REP_REGION domain-containing protein n=2 Tax=Macrostomum lignano TaxID=282301 RepID=A0A1I8H6I7_9PLAT
FQIIGTARSAATQSQLLVSATWCRRLSRLLTAQLPTQTEASQYSRDHRRHRYEHRQQPRRPVVAMAVLLGGAAGSAVARADDGDKNSQADEDELLRFCRLGDANKVQQLILRHRMVRRNHLGSRDRDGDPERRLANVRHRLGWTALAAAVVNGHEEVARLLLSMGADPNASDTFSGAFSVAARLGANSAEVSSQRSAEFSERLNHSATFVGCTPLHYAALIDSVAMVQLLLEAKADPTIRNSDGHRPSVYAPEASQVRRLLQSAELEADRRARRQFPLEQRLRQSLVGQEAAIRCVAAAVRRKENGWGDADHPLVFLFLGSSGVGKTELAKQVSLYLNRDSQQAQQQQGQNLSQRQSPLQKQQKSGNNSYGFVRLDMSEYAEKHEAAKLIGAPPGYVGYESGGQLTQALQRCPSAIVLLDEVDKAHPDVLSTLLQLFDEGRLTDGQGRTVSCKDAVFIMTSNLASDQIAEYGQRLRQAEAAGGAGRSGGAGSRELQVEAEVSRDFKDTVVRPILKRHFRRDEFLGRINEIVYFLPFNSAELAQLVNRQLNKWAAVAKDRHGIDLVWSGKAVEALSDGYDYHYGARSIKYEVDRQVVSQLALADEFGLLSSGDRVELIVSDSAKQRKVDLKICRGQLGSKDYSTVIVREKLAADSAGASSAAASE